MVTKIHTVLLSSSRATPHLPYNFKFYFLFFFLKNNTRTITITKSVQWQENSRQENSRQKICSKETCTSIQHSNTKKNQLGQPASQDKKKNTKKDRIIYLFNILQGGRATQCSIQPLCCFYPPHFCNLYSILQVVAFNTQHHMICIIRYTSLLTLQSL